MSHKPPGVHVSRMEVEKWFLDDGNGKVTTVQQASTPFRRQEPMVGAGRSQPTKLPTVEPKFETKDPVNCFRPF